MRHSEIMSFCHSHGFCSGRKQTLYEVIYKHFKAGNLRAYYVALTYPEYFDFVKW